MKNRLLNTLLLLIIPFFLKAQTVDNLMRSNGRIYVVIAVILIIIIGLFLYMIRIEKKIKKLEKHSDS